MIQRIQSLWIVLAICCVALGFCLPVADYQFTLGSGQEAVSRFALTPSSDAGWHNIGELGTTEVASYGQAASDLSLVPMWVLGVLTMLIGLVGLMLFRRRMLQVRVLLGAFLLTVVFDFVLLFWAIDAYSGTLLDAMPDAEMQHIVWQVGAYLPIVAIVFFVLAIRAIRKDEERVRAADRLR